MKPKVYTIGAISSDPHWKPKFQEIKDQYEALGCHVLSPLDHGDGLTYETYMKLSMRYVFECDSLVALPDWEDSPGAIAEVALANCLQKPVLFRGERYEKSNTNTVNRA